MATVELSERAADWLDDTPHDRRERILSKLRDAGEFPDHYLERLSGVAAYKLRIGDYRAAIEWRRDDDVLFVKRIGHRDGFYD